ncbi:hypothetical protein [Methanimicrococcus hongohii]|uniref:hypothetical protein n=1 Tax=Methanimicrococcus hongohii TaxID=3028295 RepID=UPI00292D7BB7|nr:hypothetical protein [Methanimicrococcus sp. Hf6]
MLFYPCLLLTPVPVGPARLQLYFNTADQNCVCCVHLLFYCNPNAIADVPLLPLGFRFRLRSDLRLPQPPRATRHIFEEIFQKTHLNFSIIFSAATNT